jgi:NADPH-dependent curcumin reductase CurA
VDRGAGRVIGGTRPPDKASALVEQLGFHAGLAYGTGSVVDQLRESAPDGIDVFLDNVGGRHFGDVVEVMNPRGRIALCGAMAGQLGGEPDPPMRSMDLIRKRLWLQGFTAMDHLTWEAEYLKVTRDGDVKIPHTMTYGLKSAPGALLDLF